MPKSSYGVNAEVAEPTSVRATLPKSRMQGDSTNPSQGSSDEDTPGQGRGLKKKGTEPTQVVPGSASGEKSPMMQGSSKISQPPQVTAEDIDIEDDVNALFEGSDLSEDFQYKARAIFESVVVNKINEHLERLSEEMEAELDAVTESLAGEMTEKLDSYLNYVVEQWMEENRLAVEVGIRSEISESFLQGLKSLFNEHYVDIPEDKADVVDDLATRVQELEESLSEELQRNVELNKRVNQFERELAFVEVAEGLTELQTSKLEQLTEGLSFTNPEEYRNRLETLKESYFPGYSPREQNYSLDDDPIDLTEDEAPTNSAVNAYVRAISRTVKK